MPILSIVIYLFLIYVHIHAASVVSWVELGLATNQTVTRLTRRAYLFLMGLVKRSNTSCREPPWMLVLLYVELLSNEYPDGQGAELNPVPNILHKCLVYDWPLPAWSAKHYSPQSKSSPGGTSVGYKLLERGCLEVTRVVFTTKTHSRCFYSMTL